MGKLRETERMVNMKEDMEKRRSISSLEYYKILFESKGKLKNVPTFRYRANIKYDFLQYYKIVMDWATEQTGLSRREIEVLLYLYPIALFSREEFRFMCKEIGIPHTVFNKLEGEWIKRFPDQKKTGVAINKSYFELTQKAKRIIEKMHMISVGKNEIPEINSLPNLKSSQQIRNGLFVTIADKLSNK